MDTLDARSRALLACLALAGRRDPLRPARHPELPPRRGDHGDAGDPRQLRSDAAQGEGERVESAALLRRRLGLGARLRARRMGHPLALGAGRVADRAARLPDRPAAGGPPRRPRPHRHPRLLPDADLVLAGGAVLRLPGPLRRALVLLLPARSRHPPRPRPGALGGGLLARAGQSLLRLLRGRDRGGVAGGGVARPLARAAPGAGPGRRGRRFAGPA